LIRGESGTGKELVARAVYQHGRRKNRPFLAVNCAALADTLLESELFGHEKGSFTDADRRRIGKFEQCNGGTIFLDEIGDMSPSVQGKVLRLLQKQAFERVGGTETIKTDVRIISATNRDLEKMVDKGECRLDLYHRLDNFEIWLPALRERGADLKLLVEHFLRRLTKKLDKDFTSISPAALECFKQYNWPGNDRELQSVLRKSILMSAGPVIVPDVLPEEVRNTQDNSIHSRGTPDSELVGDLNDLVEQRIQSGSTELYAATLEMMERFLLTRVLRETGGNQSHAAEMLGITRGSLRHKIRALEIKIDRIVSPD